MKKILYPHQEPARASLLETANAFFNSPWHHYAVKPRFSRILVGPSGVGKTHIVRDVAREIGVPFFSISATNWILLGASAANRHGETWKHICKFLRKNESGIIFIDELDKVGRSDEFTESAWSQYLRVEIYGLLDLRIPTGVSLSSEEEEEQDPQLMLLLNGRLARRMMVVGAGAFQGLWEGWAKPSIGIRQSAEVTKNAFTNRDMQRVIPVELSNRFAAPAIVINPLEFEDYRQLLYLTAEKLPQHIASRLISAGLREIGSAVESGLGVRWIEGLLLKVLVERSKGAKESSLTLAS